MASIVNGVSAEGHVEAGWSKVADAFRANFEGIPGEVGAACCVYVGGRPVVDLWGGLVDSRTKRPWNEDTIAQVASTTKGATAICAHMLAQRGQLDLDAPVVELLARIRCKRQGPDPGTVAALAPGRPSGHRQAR